MNNFGINQRIFFNELVMDCTQSLLIIQSNKNLRKKLLGYDLQIQWNILGIIFFHS